MAGQSIGQLLIDLALNTAAFASDLNKASQNLRSWQSQQNQLIAGAVNSWRGLQREVGGFIDRTFTLRNAIGVVAGAAGIGLLIKNSMQAAETIVNTADAIGLTTKTLQEYQYAGKLSGINTETMNKALETFTRNMGQAANNTGRLYSFLRNSDPILLKQIQSTKSTDEALTQVVRTMGKYQTAGARAALANAAFGNGMIKVTNLVKDGVNQFDALRAAASAVGAVVADDLLRNLEASGDKFDALAMIMRAQLITAVAQSSNELATLAQNLTVIIPVFAKAAAHLSTFIASLINFKQTLKDAAIGVQALGIAFDKWVGLDSAETTAKRVDNLKKKIQEMNKETTAAAQNTSQNSLANPAMAKGLADYEAQMRRLAESTKGAEDAHKRLANEARRLNEKGVTPLQQYNAEMEKYNQMLKQNLISQEIYNDAVSEAGDKYVEAMNKESMWADFSEKLLRGQIKTWDDLKSAALDYIRQLLVAIMQGKDVSKMFNFASGTPGSGGGLGNIFGSIVGGIGDFFGGIGDVFGFHSGGVVGAGGTPRNVHPSVFAGARRMHNGGLAGDEVPAILQKGEIVIPKDGTSKMGGNNFFIDARGADTTELRRLERLLMALAGPGVVEKRVVSGQKRGMI